MSDQGEIQSQESASVESRISSLAERLRTPLQDQPEQGEQTSVESETEAQDVPEGEEGAEAQAQTEPELSEIEYEGKTHKVPPEIKDAVLRHADYTRKTQEISDRRRVIEQREVSLMQNLQLAEQLAPAFGQLSMLDQQLMSIRSQLTPQLEADDPFKYNTLGTKFNLLSGERQNLVQGIEYHKGQLLTAQQQRAAQDFQERAKNALPKVQSAIKNWGPEAQKNVAEYARKAGFSQEELAHIASSDAAVISLWKADQFDRLQAAKQSAQPKTPNLPPVAKPGSRNSAQSEQTTRAKQLHQDWQKGGGKSTDGLAAILRNRLKGK